MKFELHIVDGEIKRFTAAPIEEGRQYASGYVLGNHTWIDYVVANPGRDDASIVNTNEVSA
jgi:hypothetical protein